MRSEAGKAEQDPLARVRETVRRLAAPDGCAWHGVQSHESLTPFLVEEASELIDAIERKEPAAEVSSELGDVLYQVLFHAAIAERDGEGYDLDSVADALDKKLIARHPHVFGERGYMSVEELNAAWERLKEDAAGEARGSRGALDGIPAGMPTLARAAKVVERFKRAQLIDPSAAAAELSLAADLSSTADLASGGSLASDSNLATTVASEGQRITENEIGDELLALVAKANVVGVDPDRALRGAIDRLAKRHLPE